MTSAYRSLCLAVLLTASPLFAQGAIQPDVLKAEVNKQMPLLTSTYKQLHTHPELSHHEEKTSAFLAGELRSAGYNVVEHIGTYPDGSKAWGILALLKNGSGPTVLIRTDMDALPVTEATGLEYASHARSLNAENQEVGVMHACGHDIHMTVFLGVARELAANKAHWHGTVELVGQPSEETIDGAKAMMADDLYTRFPKPDFILDTHDTNDYAAGNIAISPGPLLASSTSVKIVFHGIGSHGSRPAAGKDPIVMGAEFVMLAQTIVSRQIDTQDPSVLTVGMFNAGTKNNIIPDDAVLQLSMRAYSEDARLKLLDGVKRTANGVASAYGIAADRMPEVTVFQSTPATLNDAALSDRVRTIGIQTLGASRVDKAEPVMGSEDVGIFTLDGKIPLAMFWMGAADPEKLALARKTNTPLPSPHSALFAPVFEPTIRTGVTMMTAAALDLLH